MIYAIDLIYKDWIMLLLKSKFLDLKVFFYGFIYFNSLDLQIFNLILFGIETIIVEILKLYLVLATAIILFNFITERYLLTIHFIS